MKKTHILLLALCAIGAIALAFSVFTMYHPSEDPGETALPKEFEEMELNPPPDYIDVLEDRIRRDPDPYVRERGIATLTSIAIRRNETDQIIPFLKELAYNEDDDEVRTAAYANIGLIRLYHPLPSRGTLTISIDGHIAKGKNITVVATVTPTVDVPDATIGISRFDTGLYPATEPVIRTSLQARVPKEFRFGITLNEAGSYEVPVAALLSWDRVDSEYLEKAIILTVTESNGTSTIAEDESAELPP
jgi:hypothetical protein